MLTVEVGAYTPKIGRTNLRISDSLEGLKTIVLVIVITDMKGRVKRGSLIEESDD